MARPIRERIGERLAHTFAPVRAVTNRVPPFVWTLLFAAILVVYPLVVNSPYWARVGALVAILAIAGNALNLLAGIAGLLDMGFIAFYAVGGYTYALLNSDQFGLHIGFWPSLPIAMIVAGIFGVIIGVPSLRVRGDYLAIVTLAFFYIVQQLILNLARITNGPNGITPLGRPSLFGFVFRTPGAYFYLLWVFAALVLFVCLRLMYSRSGRAWAGIRDDEITASCMGVNLPRYRVNVFVATASLMGLAGALIAAFQVGVFPENFTLDTLVAIYLLVILGGQGNPTGVVVGAVLYTFLGELLRRFPSIVQWRMAIVSLLLLVVVIVLPMGVLRARSRKSKTTLEQALSSLRGQRLAPAIATSSAPVGVGSEDVASALGGGHVAHVVATDSVGAAEAECAPRAVGEVILSIRNLTKAFGGVVAVEDVSFDVREGEILGIIGPNGAGKTTLFNLITGIYKPDRGTVTYRGEDITGRTPDRVATKGVARTFQNIRIFPQLSVLDNVMAGAHPWLKAGIFRSILRLPATAREEREAELEGIKNLAFFSRSLAERKDEYVTVLNYADRRRVEIARAMTLRPDILCLDEPAAGMNPAEVEEISQQIVALRDAGYTIILVEHQMPVVMGCSDRIVVMNKGQVLTEGTPKQVQEHPEVIKAYLGEKHDLTVAPKVSLVQKEPLLRLRGVHASYGAVKVLKGIDLDVYPGEIICLLGANAAGKSTTIKTILGNVRASEGTIEFDGRRIETWPTSRVVSAGIAIVPEGRRIFPLLTVLDNLRLGAYSVKDQSISKRAIDRAFEQFPVLYERRNQQGGTLSGGEQQMLAIARALMSEPKLLCLDEPSMGLSPILVRQVFDIIEDINKKGTTIFMVEQNAQMALQIAHRAYVLQTGSIVLTDEAYKLAEGDAVKKAYLGD